jgi:hypothetical protein
MEGERTKAEKMGKYFHRKSINQHFGQQKRRKKAAMKYSQCGVRYALIDCIFVIVY